MKALKRMSHEDLERTVVAFDMDDPETGAIFWSGDEGYVLKLPEVEQPESLPLPLYLLGLCFMRLNNDEDFVQELLTWSKRKPH